MKATLIFLACIAAASAGLIGAPVTIAAGLAGPTILTRAPSLDSAVIKSDRLGGNFAYSVAESHAYVAQTPIVKTVATPIAVSYSPVPYATAPVAVAAAPVVTKIVAPAPIIAPASVAYAAAPAPVAYAAAPAPLAVHAAPVALAPATLQQVVAPNAISYNVAPAPAAITKYIAAPAYTKVVAPAAPVAFASAPVAVVPAAAKFSYSYSYPTYAGGYAYGNTVYTQGPPTLRKLY